MNQNKHTPGPWLIHDTIIETIEEKFVAQVANDARGAIDAKLISAAPELLAACEAALKRAAEVLQRAEHSETHANVIYVIGSLYDAMRKAKGE